MPYNRISTVNLCDWSQILKPGKKTKKPTEQLAANNMAINEFKEQTKRAKNVVIYGHLNRPNDMEQLYVKRLRSKTVSKLGSILLEL